LREGSPGAHVFRSVEYERHIQLDTNYDGLVGFEELPTGLVSKQLYEELNFKLDSNGLKDAGLDIFEWFSMGMNATIDNYEMPWGMDQVLDLLPTLDLIALNKAVNIVKMADANLDWGVSAEEFTNFFCPETSLHCSSSNPFQSVSAPIPNNLLLSSYLGESTMSEVLLYRGNPTVHAYT